MRTQANRDLWKERLGDWDFAHGTVDSQAKELGVVRATVYNWRKSLTDDEVEEITQRRDRALAREKLEVHSVLLQKAKDGNIEAIKHADEVLFGWSRTQRNENISINPELEGLSEEDIQRKALKKMPTYLIQEELSLRQAPKDVVNEKAVGS